MVWAICPDGFLAERHVLGSCVQGLLPLDTTAPADAPLVSGTSGNNGWYTSDVLVAWTWTDAGSGIDSSNCTQTSGSSGEGSGVVVASSCTDLAGNAASDSRTFMIDKMAPTVTVTNVTDGAQYVLGPVPAAGCSTDRRSELTLLRRGKRPIHLRLEDEQDLGANLPTADRSPQRRQRPHRPIQVQIAKVGFR